jgi:phospholipid transport system substrate-binding protein
MVQRKHMSFMLLLAGAALIWGTASADISGQAVAGYAPAAGEERLLTPVAEDVTAGAQKFIAGMTKRGIDFLGDGTLTQEQRRAEFKQLLDDSFDMSTIGRFALGRYWRDATKKQQNEYLSLFKKMVIDVYSNRFEEYSGQTLEVRSARPEGRDTLVTSFIVPSSGPEVQVDWRVRNTGGRYKVVDVIVEGVSMTLTQRSDFASVIQRGGGNLDALLTHMRK